MSSPSGDKIIVQFNLKKKKVNGKKVFTKNPTDCREKWALLIAVGVAKGKREINH